jgi:antitoxin MazE
MEMMLEDGRLVLVPIKRPLRVGWAEASQRIAGTSDDILVWPEFGNADDDTLTW